MTIPSYPPEYDYGDIPPEGEVEEGEETYDPPEPEPDDEDPIDPSEIFPF